jgi:processive 1,2-diacylglycerol beta-glucosyltransferase
MPVDLVVVHCPVGGGHKSAALAVAEAAQSRGLRVEVLDTFEHAPSLFGRAYLTVHLAAQGGLPEVYGAAFFLANRRDGALEPLRRGVDHLAWAGLVKRVIALAPRAIVATHHLPLLVLGRARRIGSLASPLVGVVTDYGTHAVWAEKGVDALCLAASAAREAVAHGFSPHRLHVTGIPIRPAFESIPPVLDPEPSEPLRVLVTSGGFGVGPIGAMVRSFAGIERVHVTVVCGRSDGLARRVERLAARARIDARVIGFERDMPARVAEAHLLVGKAGGLTVTEAMTAGRPMIIAGAVPGNEGVNARFVVSAGAGVVSHPAHVGALADALRSDRRLGAMGRSARDSVTAHAARRVVDVAISAVDRAAPARAA